MPNKNLLAAFLACIAAPADAAGPWRSIFDGKSLDGWTAKITGHELGYNYRDTFRVQDGAIRVSYDGYDAFGGRFGHLSYEKPVGAFRARFEYRFYGQYLPDVEAWQHSNSGLMFHGQAPETIARDQKFPVSLELQLLGADGSGSRPSGNLCTPGTDVVIGGTRLAEHCINSSSPTFPNGRWVEVEVEVTQDGRITHFINGKPVLAYSEARLDPADADAKPLLARAGASLALKGGYLSLQSEGHPVEFRNIELMELD